MDTECSRVWCGGLPSDISEPELYEEFSKHGEVELVSIRSSPRDTFAFIQMLCREDADAAISKLFRARIWGSPGLQVKIAHNRPEDLDRKHEDTQKSSQNGGLADLQNDLDPYGLWTDCRPSHERSGKADRTARKGRCELRPATCRLRSGQHWSPSRSRSPASPASKGSSLLQRAEERGRRLSITLENIPDDMSWLELKNLGRMYGHVEYARAFREGSVSWGSLEFSRIEDKEQACRALEGQRIEGSKLPLRVHDGAAPQV